MVKLKKEGKGSVQHKNLIGKEDIAKIFAVLDITMQQGLQDKVFVDFHGVFINVQYSHLLAGAAGEDLLGVLGIRYIYPKYFSYKVLINIDFWV